MLADYFREQANWRDHKAAEYPDDNRNEQSARALNSLADYVERGDVEDADALTTFVYEGLSLGGEEASRVVSRYGFGYNATTASQHDEFLRELWGVCLSDAYDLASMNGEDPSGILAPAELDAAQREVTLPSLYFTRRRGMTEQEIEEEIAAYEV